jgi:translocation and assembly module TamB
VKDARIENNVGRAKIVGDLRLTGNNVQPGLLGTLEATEGSEAFFRGNQFNVSQGVVEFKDRQGFDGVFDMHAETEVREYVIRLHAFGRTSDPHVLLSSDPELAEGDIISLLTLGVISKDKTNTAGTSAGLAAEALFNASGLDRQVQRFLPKNSVLRDLAFHISTTYNDATGLVEPTAQIESRFLTERLKLTMSQPVSGHGSKAQAEYRFNDRLSAQAQWDNEHQDFAFGNLGMDLTLRWDVE